MGIQAILIVKFVDTFLFYVINLNVLRLFILLNEGIFFSKKTKQGRKEAKKQKLEGLTSKHIQKC